MLLRQFLKGMSKSKYRITKDGLPMIDFQGIPIAIEQQVGSFREGVKADGTKWKTKFFYPYGFVVGAYKNGDDGDEIDCFVGPNQESQRVFIFHQVINDKYDELKVLFGFDTEESARDAYLAHYDTQNYLGPISEMSVQQFKEFIGNQFIPISAFYVKEKK